MREWESQLLSTVALVALLIGVGIVAGGWGLVALGLTLLALDYLLENRKEGGDASDPAAESGRVGVRPHQQHAVHATQGQRDDSVQP